MKSEKALGRGLKALLQKAKPSPSTDNSSEMLVEMIPLYSISTNDSQPRTSFDPELLEELATSIRQHGVLQPVLLERVDGDLKLIAGERRYRASLQAGLTEIPAIISHYTDIEKREIALIENIQREDLHPLDIANSIENLIRVTHWTQAEAAEHLGMSRSKLTNLLRLLDLHESVQSCLKSGIISASHARAIGGLQNVKQASLCVHVIDHHCSVRETEQLVALMQNNMPLKDAILHVRKENKSPNPGMGSSKNAQKLSKKQKESSLKTLNSEEKFLIDRMMVHFGTKIQLKKGKIGGELSLTYYDTYDLMRIVELLHLPNED